MCTACRRAETDRRACNTCVACCHFCAELEKGDQISSGTTVVVEVKHAEIGTSPSQGIDGGMVGTGSLSAAPLHDLTLQAKAAFLLDLPAEAKVKFVEREQKRMKRQQEHDQYKDFMSRSSAEVQRKVLKSADLDPLVFGAKP